MDVEVKESWKVRKDKRIETVIAKLKERMSKKEIMINVGNVEGNEKGKYTFIRSTGQSVIDYTIVDTVGLDKVRKFIVKERVESDHMPVCCKLEYKIQRRRRNTGNKIAGKME